MKDLGASFLALPIPVDMEVQGDEQVGTFQRLREVLAKRQPRLCEKSAPTSHVDVDMENHATSVRLRDGRVTATARFSHRHPTDTPMSVDELDDKLNASALVSGGNFINFEEDDEAEVDSAHGAARQEDHPRFSHHQTRVTKNILDAAEAESVIRALTTVAHSPVWLTAAVEAGAPVIHGVQRECDIDGRYLYTGRSLARILHQEVMDFVACISPSPEEHKMRLFCLRRISDVIHSMWPEAVVKVFGSFETQLYLPSSDLDVVVFCGETANKTTLNKLAAAIVKENLAQDLQVIPARVPIIKFTENVTQFSCDISLNMENGVRSAEVMKKLMGEHPSLRPLIMVIKQFLVMRGLNEVYSGGLGSYGLTLMVTNFLKVHPLVQSGAIREEDNLGVLLMDFLDLFGRRFNYDSVGITIEEQRLYCGKGFGKAGTLSAIDPADDANDVTRGSFNMINVRKSFGNAMDILEGTFYERSKESVLRETSDDKTDHARHYSLHSILGTVINVPESIVQHRQFVLEQYHSEAAGIDEAIRFIDGIFSRSPRSIIARNSRQSVPTKRAKSKAKKPSKKKRKQNGKGASMGRAEM